MKTIESLYRKYFQKSGVFLYPLLGIKRGHAFVPVQTYLKWDQFGVDTRDRRLICLYEREDSQDYRNFERELKGNKLYDTTVLTEHNKVAYVFDYSSHSEDWAHFLRGKYSLLSVDLKRAIKDFYKKSGDNYVYIESFLYPQKYFALYAELLGTDMETLKEVGQLCSKPDMHLETLSIDVLRTDIKPVKNNGD